MLKIPTEADRLIDFNHFEFVGEESLGLITAQSPVVSISVSYNLAHPAQAINYSDYQVHILHSNRFNKENDIFQIKDRSNGKRIGWIFPIQSIVSDQHDKALNPYFLNYSYAAFSNLLSGNYTIANGYHHLKNISLPPHAESFELNEIFSDDLIIVCLSNSTLSEGFSLEDYLLSLLAQSYSFKRRIVEDNLVERVIVRPDICLWILPICESLKSDFYIKEIFKNYLLESTNELFRFHLLYQVIELFIDKIFDLEVPIVISQGLAARELSEKLSALSNERFRINLLFSDYTTLDKADTDNFCLVLNNFLINFSASKDNFWEGLYKARNIMVHRYREAIQLKTEIIVICDLFEGIILQTILNYKK
jgi:hypothetical protein